MAASRVRSWLTSTFRHCRPKGFPRNDVDNAINAQNLILPAGTAKIGDTEYNVRVNSSPNVVEEFNNLPIKTVNGAVYIRMRDVAQVHDGYAVQTKYREPERQTRRPADDPQKRRRFHAAGRGRHQEAMLPRVKGRPSRRTLI